MFRKSFFKKAGVYSDKHRKNQDTFLWYKGFKNKCIFANLDVPILKFRINTSFYNTRRGGVKRAYKMLKDRIKINKELNYGLDAYVYAIMFFFFTLTPSYLKKVLYKYR